MKNQPGKASDSEEYLLHALTARLYLKSIGWNHGQTENAVELIFSEEGSGKPEGLFELSCKLLRMIEYRKTGKVLDDGLALEVKKAMEQVFGKI